MRLFCLIGFLFLMSACRRVQHQESSLEPVSVYRPEYAKGFEIRYYDGFSELLVKDESSKKILQKAIMLNRGANIPAGFENHTRIDLPLRRLVCVSTTHAVMFSELGKAELLVGMMDTSLSTDARLRDCIAKGQIKPLSGGGQLDAEKLLAAEPDLLLIDDYVLSGIGGEEKINSLGIQAMLLRDFVEEHPLGRAEWMVFAAALCGKEQDGRAFFKKVSHDYDSISRLAIKGDRPTVFCNLPWKDIWYMPGGGSYFARLLKDAGARYFWENDRSARALQLDFEEVYAKARAADFWLNVNIAGSLEAMTAADPRFADFSAWKNRRVFNNDKIKSVGGGFGFWESGSIHPEWVLADLIHIFKNDIDSLHFYRQLR